jgi:hypothetical protein
MVMNKSIAFFIVANIIFAWYLNLNATRLDRLHHRVETSWANLDALLQRRAALAQEIAHLPGIDTASNIILTSAAHQARTADIASRSDAESGLSGALRLLRDESDVFSQHQEIFAELDSITERIKTAVSIHREAVVATRARRAIVVNRVFRLAGHAPLPVTYPFEDDVL